MSSMTFLVNDQSTGSTNPKVWVTITENPDGTLSFVVTQEGGIIGDLRGIFFDVADESLIGSLKVLDASLDPTKVLQGNDTIKDLGSGSTMQGLLGSDGGYDMGIAVGTAGIGKDDIQTYSFTLDSSLRDLTLDDFANVDFGLRLTSVGTIDGSRDDSSKILEHTSSVIHVQDDSACVDENAIMNGNVLDNDKAGLPIGDVVSVTGWSGGTLGQAIVLTNAEGATLTLNADGSYTLDASTADALSQNEHLEFTFTYDAKSMNESTSWSVDSGTLTVCIDGQNDGPVATNDSVDCIMENETTQGAVLGNDSDIDRLDTMSVSAVNSIMDGGVGDLDANAGSIKVLLDSGALVTMDMTTGHFVYDTNGAFDALNNGQEAGDSFIYTVMDNNGATDNATVSLCIEGVGSDTEPPIDFPEFANNSLSNIVFYLDNDEILDNNMLNGESTIFKLKFEDSVGGIQNLDDLGLTEWIADHATELNGFTHVLAYTIHGGIEFPNTWESNLIGNTPPKILLQPGEGIFFMNDGDQVPDAEEIIDLHDNGSSSYLSSIGITASILGAAADEIHMITSISPVVIV